MNDYKCYCILNNYFNYQTKICHSNNAFCAFTRKKNDNKITKSKIRLKNKIINLTIHLMSTILLAWYFFTSND